MKILQLLTLFAFLFLISCSQNDEVDPEDDLIGSGSFEVTLSGAESRTIKGEAYFVQSILTTKSEPENGSVLGISLTSNDEEEEIITLTVGKAGDLDGVNTGTYTIDLESEDDTEIVNLGAFLEGSLTTYLGTSGKITIKKVEKNRVEGSVSAVLDNMNGKVLNISGEFTAEGITENL
jgi:hypothetical protein